MAAGALALLDGLGVRQAVVLGHHTGAVVAQELAAAAPERVRALVLSAMPWIDEARRRTKAVPVDHAAVQEDGGHLVDLWRQRAPYYPPERPDLLDRFIRDALAPGVDPAEGHRAVGRYPMEERIGLVSAPTLLICADRDPFSSPALEKVRRGLATTTVAVHHVTEGTVPLMETCAAEIAAAVRGFLADLSPHPRSVPTRSVRP
jgi:pimeloyl-ACP methyl ester carboxylesterase